MSDLLLLLRLDTGLFECKKLAMEPIESSSSSNKEEVEAVDLLEECWFFDNLFKKTSTRMLRCNSDPCTSSKFSQEMLVKSSSDIESSSTNSSTKELSSVSGDQPQQGVVHANKLIRAPSLPPCIGRKEENVQEKESNMNNGGSKLIRQSSLQAPKPTCAGKKEGYTKEKGSTATRNKLSGQSSRRRLLRTPSLPPGIGRQDIDQDKESDARMSILIQQAFANSSDIFYSRHTSKGMAQSCIPRYRPPRNSEAESSNTNGIKEMNRRYGLNQGKIRKTLSDLESEEVQGFKDLGFTFDKDDLSPSVVNIIPGLHEKNPEELNQDNNMRRPYLSEAWVVQSCAPAVPPVPNWVARDSAEDMKTQIKFWARAVASNVRVQEC